MSIFACSHRRRVSAVVFSLLLGAYASADAPIRALILSGSNNHDWAQTTPALKRILEESGRFAVEVTEDPASLDAAALAPYDLVVSNWNNYPAEDRVWGEQAEQALLDFVRGGKGFALFHAASACLGTWPEYQQLVGATWDKGATAHGAIHEFPVKIVDKEHPVTRGMADFRTRDELWHKMAVQPSARVLCTAFSAQDQGGTGQDEPVALTTEFGKGRGFYLILGHDAPAMEDMDWRLLMLRGAEWAATGRATITSPIDADLALAGIVKYKRYEERSRLRAVEQLVQQAAINEAQRTQLASKMTALLGSPDATDDAKAFLLQQLSLTGGAAEVPAIAALIGHETLGFYALTALERIPAEAASTALREALPKLAGSDLVGVINALGERRDAKAVAPLAGLLTNEDDALVRAAIDALGRIGNEAAIKALTALPEGRREAAADALLACADRLTAAGDGKRAAPIYRSLVEPARPEQVRAAAFAGQVACAESGRVELLLSALRGDDAALHAGAARALRTPTARTAAERIAAELPTFAPTAQAQVIYALCDLGAPEIVPNVVKLISSPDPSVRSAVVRALGRLGDAAVWPMLLDALKSDPPEAERRAIEEALAGVGGRVLLAGGELPLALAGETPTTRASLLRALGGIPHPQALQLAAAQIADAAVSQEACLAATQIAERLPAEHKAAIQAALEKVMAASRDDERTRTRARTVLLALGIPVEVTRSVTLQDPGPNLALGATANSPDDIDSDGAASGDQAGIDGDPATYWDEVNDQPLYRFKVAFAAPTEVSAIRIMGHQHHMHSPKDFDILCDDRVVLTVKDAWYESNQFAVTFPRTKCTTLELRITGGYGPSPAIRELEIFGRP